MKSLKVNGSEKAMQELGEFLLGVNIAEGERVYTWEVLE